MGTGSFTLSAWVNTTFGGVGNNNGIFYKRGTATFESVGYRLNLRSGEFNFHIADDINYASLSSVDKDFNDGRWHHVVAQRDSVKGKIFLFVDGKPQGELTDTIGNIDNNIFFSIGALSTEGTNIFHPFYGEIDEVAIWSRTLTESDVRQLYRRGANRVKLQVKSCVDSSCNCKSYNVAPAGSETDCDGDGILNTADNDDTHKAEFIGPGGDGTTYYSELYNRNPTDVTFNCALNTTDSNPGVCVEDEITLAGSPKPTGPNFLDIDYTQFVTPSPNRYAQYRVYMEADENTACSGEPCLPELTSVNLNPVSYTHLTLPTILLV